MDNVKTKTIYILQGPPASGKSTWAADFIKQQPNTIIANRDSIRYELGNGTYKIKPKDEDKVTNMEIKLVLDSIDKYEYIIIDDTNLNQKTIDTWNKLLNNETQTYDIKYVNFYVPFETAVKNDEKRKAEGGHSVGKKVLEFFYKRYFKDQFEEEMRDKRIIKEFSANKRYCIICDLDGTLALHQGRTPFEWERIPEDKVDKRLEKTLEVYCNSGVTIFFVTGRPTQQGDIDIKQLTLDWLDTNLSTNIQKNYYLFMRKPDDRRSGELVKEEIYLDKIEPYFNVLCCFEDSNKCVSKWRALGLLCCQVENADY